MKKLFLLFLVSLFTVGLFAQNEKFVSNKYKFKMDVPDGFVFKTAQDGEWGRMIGIHPKTDTKLNAFTRKGVYTKDEIYDFGVNKTGIPRGEWKIVAEGKDKNGFEWYERYKSDYNGKVLFALIGKNKGDDIYYLMFVLGPKGEFVKHEKNYKEWMNSFTGVNITKDKILDSKTD
ncbi:MAG: hypothetical protein K8R54_04345 [Bacteroidales bacterium]|nr:hypothetical protein [Bacteroidales bacterium]